MLQVEHLTKRYGAVTAVDDLSFEIAGAGVYGFLGPNGAGKSTAMNIMTGCLSAAAGTVKISGYDIYESPREAKRRVGYLPEQPPLCLGETPAEFLRFVGEAKGLRGAELRRQIDAVVEETAIGDMRQRRISALSKGYRQRVGIAQALLGEPDTVILDEPTVGLDPIQILEIRALIASLGESRTVLIAADPTTDRYSFKIEFDHYVDGQTCFGLDKLVLNNNYADAAGMKEALIYDMYRYFGADASLYNYAKISVNGEYWGVYLALEAVEDSFMLRNYGAQSGELYKPDSMNIGGDFDMGGFGGQGGASDTAPADSGSYDIPQLPEGFDISDFGGGERPEGFDPSGLGGETPPEGSAPEETGEAPQESAEPAPEGTAAPEGEGGGDTGAPSFGGFESGGMPSFGGPGGDGSTGGEGSGGALAQYGLSLGVFAAALIFALLYRRRPRRR